MKEITFDRFMRGALWVGTFVVLGIMLRRLSDVLLPFFVAWFIAYMLYPLVRFFQYRCHLRNRTLSIVVALTLVLLAIAGLLFIVVPPTIAEFMKLKDVAVDYFGQWSQNGRLTEIARHYIDNYVSHNRWMELMQNDNVLDGVREAIRQLFNVLYSTVEFLMGIFTVFITLLYMFFILLDYESLSQGWIKLVPAKSRWICLNVARDVKKGMSAYFRGQALVALCVGILFSIGFLIIGFPMAVGLGMFIGLLNMVPYLQLLGFVPTIVLSLIESANTGESFWLIFLSAFAVFCVVQVIQDVFLTPKIMGKTMGMHPAIIFLSLSVWGSLLGFIGLVIALPLTTILISYYRQIIEHYGKK